MYTRRPQQSSILQGILFLSLMQIQERGQSSNEFISTPKVVPRSRHRCWEMASLLETFALNLVLCPAESRPEDSVSLEQWIVLGV